MAFLWKHPQSKYFVARFFDLTGKRRNRSTRVLAHEKNRKEAERIADAYEDAANKRRTARQVRDVIASLHKEITGDDLPSHSFREFAETWLTRKGPEVAAGTLAFYRGAVAKFTAFLGAKADAELGEITSDDVVKRGQIRGKVLVNFDSVRARRLAFHAFRLLLNCESATILESSGSGGWHVWAIAEDFKPVAHWIRLLKGIAREIGAPVESGVCEIFPPDTLSRGFGKGLRAPGGWNPGTNALSEIYWQNADALIAGLPLCVSGKQVRIGEVTSFYSGASPIEKKTSLSLPLSLSALGKIIGRTGDFRISRMATRREMLKCMVGTTFHQLSRPVAEQMARAQFAERTVVTNADEAEHMRDFASLWTGLDNPWLTSLAPGESERFAQLSTEAERGAFRIIRSYAQKAARDGYADFPIARDNLGNRVGISGNGAGQMRVKLVRLGIITPTVPYAANKTPARYQWTAPRQHEQTHENDRHGPLNAPAEP